MMTDEQILDLYFAREERAIDETTAKYGSGLTHFACRFIEDEDAKECVNDTYLAAWNRIPPTRPQKFFVWLSKVCRNIICDRLDHANAAKRSAQMVSLTEELEECLPDPKLYVDVDSYALGEALNGFLHGLSGEHRILFLRRYWYGLSVKELAEETGLGESNVKTTLYRVRGQLKEYLEKGGHM